MGTKSRLRPDRLSTKLVQIREALGGSQGDMVTKLGFTGRLTRERISAYENGKREPASQVLLAYGRVAGVWVDVLLDDELDLPGNLPAAPKSGGTPHTHAKKHRPAKTD
ncbi:MAG TPA: helix-turn-helix transcriptional regulator [Blastocatellia bacterium]